MKQFCERNMLLIDFIVALALAALAILGIEKGFGRESLEKLLNQDRQALYGTVAQVSASLLGFILAAVTIILAFSDVQRLKVLRASSQFSVLADIWSLLRCN